MKNRHIGPLCVPVVAASLLITALALAGCASTPPPKAEMAKAELAVSQARESSASTRARLPLSDAEAKLSEAKDAMYQEDYEKARLLAEEALIDAQLAETQSNTAEIKQIVSNLEESVNSLKNEIQMRESNP